MILGYKRTAATSADWPPASWAEICLEVDSIFTLIQLLRPDMYRYPSVLDQEKYKRRIITESFDRLTNIWIIFFIQYSLILYIDSRTIKLVELKDVLFEIRLL
jgi:hypothetical protein